MLSVNDLASFGAPRALVDLWSANVAELTDIQEKAVRAGVLDGATNVLAVAPTSSGKTLIGELAATSSAYTRRATRSSSSPSARSPRSTSNSSTSATARSCRS
jgi:superfamily II RNA helicase